MKKWIAHFECPVCGEFSATPKDECPFCKSKLTSDVKHVRYAKWRMDENPHDGDCRCTGCGSCCDDMHERNHGVLNALTGNKWWTFLKYCPMCGAEMVGVEDGISV